MALQHIVLPAFYQIACLCTKRPTAPLVVFADSHHTTLPFSMERMYQAVSELGYPVVIHLHDYSNEGAWRSFIHSVEFMFLYVKSEYVFICDNFLPVSSCKKKSGTKVIQLWHSCGLLKKMGYDTSEDVPDYYKGNVYKNYDLVTVSAPCCVPHLTSGMQQPPGVVQPLGVSRTDVYFDQVWMEKCKREFFSRFPEATGKNVLLWAPTFRGNAASPTLVGEKGILHLKEQLGSEWFVIIKLHPHLEKNRHYKELSTLSCEIPTERLLPVTNLLITDYSSVLFDYLLLKRPFVLFAPDWKLYENARGFYIDYLSLSKEIATNEEELANIIQKTWAHREDPVYQQHLDMLCTYHNASCQGKATEQILRYLKMRNV